MMFRRQSTSSFSSTGSIPTRQHSLQEADVVREGWLRKKGHLFATVKSRYFILYADCHLVYLKDVKKKKQKGSVELAMSDMIAPHPTKKNDKLFGFDLKKAASGSDATSTKPYTLTMFASTAAERSEWIDAIRRVTAMQSTQRMLSVVEASAATDRNSSSGVLGTVASNPRDTFCVLIELGELQQLVTLAQSTWDADPLKWSHDQYLELCRSIVFTHEKAVGANMQLQESQVLQDALALRYQYEDAQAQLQARRQSIAAPLATNPPEPDETPEPPTASTPTPPATPTGDPGAEPVANKPLPVKVARYFSSLNASFVASSPRSKTIAKYAHLYQEEALTAKRAWNILREDADDILNAPSATSRAPWTVDDLTRLLHDRFDRDRIYTSVGDTLIAINPAPRLVHHSAGNSIYDESTAMWYRDHDLVVGSPHPFALAKRTLASVRENKRDECIVMIGESGSGKTDFAKQVLKYIALVQHALKPPHVQLFTSSTKSTIKMRSDESHLMDLLRLKHVQYETIYLDITPERWPEMLVASGGVKQLPQLHMDSLFFGNYDELQRLEDEEQFVFYVKNPKAARLTSVLLDGNVLLEAFGNAKTVHNPNSSRFGKSTSFSIHATTGHLLGGAIEPFFLETSRVTSLNPDDANFHIFYALLVGASDALADECHVKNATPATFAYLGKPTKHASTNVRNSKADEDRVRWNRVLRCLDLVGVTDSERSAIFRVLAAVLYLGNIAFEDTLNNLGVATGVRVQTIDVLEIVASLLSIDAAHIARVMCTKQLSVTKKDEVYELQVHARQASITRESFARLLYDSLFSALVGLLNRSSMVPKDEHVHEITLVDVFGFEDLGTNSFEQLCINYLTEKLSAFELEYAGEVQGALYFAEGLERYWSSVLNISEGAGLQVMNSPVGVWACLDEATVLHGNEDDPKQLKNSRFVRALYSRNVDHAGLSVRKDPVEFAVNHNRSSVTYKATDFVFKNSQDGLQPLVQLIGESQSPFVKALQKQVTLATNDTKRQTTAARFKGHVQAIVDKLTVARPRFVHCLRPRSSNSKDLSSLDASVVKAQVQGQLLAPIVTYASQIFRHSMAFPAFHSSYHMLFHDISNADGVEAALRTFVASLPVVAGTSYEYAVGTTTVFFNEPLSLALQAQRLVIRSAACVRIQSAIRMWLATRLVEKVRESTRNYIRDITQFYAKHNPSKLSEVPTIVRAFRGREGVLFEKLKQKYMNDQHPAPAQDERDTSLEDFILKVHFDATTVQKMLSNPKMALLLGEPNILQALREVSIDPSVIYLQTSDPVLRLFYTELKLFFTPNVNPQRVPYDQMPLEDAIQKLVHLQLLEPTADMTPEDQTIVREIAVDPMFLAFHIDQPGVREMLERLIRNIERNPSTLLAEVAAETTATPATAAPAATSTPVVEPTTGISAAEQSPDTSSPLPDQPPNVAVVSVPLVQVAEPSTPEPSPQPTQLAEPAVIPNDGEPAARLDKLSSFEVMALATPSAEPSPVDAAQPAVRQRFQDMPLEAAVDKLIEARLFCPTSDMSPEEQTVIQEIASDPPLLAFHIDEPSVQQLLRRLCRLVDDMLAQAALPPPSAAGEPAANTGPPSDGAPAMVEFKRVKITNKLMKKIMNDDGLMAMMGEPKVLEFFEEFSETKSTVPTISFPANETQLIEFYAAVLHLSQS